MRRGLVDDADIRELAHLGAVVAPDAGPAIAQLTEDMNWLAARAAKVRTDPKVAYDWRGLPWPEWEERMARVVGTLERLAARG